MGGIYKEQEELTSSSKPVFHKDKKLIVLHNFTSSENCTCIMTELKDASTDIIVVSNELLCKEQMAKDFDKHFSRGCNIIEVTSLQPISIMQRIVYALLEKNSFVARDADHIVFTLLSEYSQGAATIVHMLTSLMQKGEDDSRTGFELAKKQLKVVNQGSRIAQESEISDNVQSNDHQTTPSHLNIPELSKPAHSLLTCLSKFGSDPLPQFYIEELANLIIKEQGTCQTDSKSILKELESSKIARKCPYPLVYHKDLNPECLDFSVQLFTIPKLICDTVKNDMYYENSIIHLQYALEESIKHNPSSRFIHVLSSGLKNLCKREQEGEQQFNIGLERIHQVPCLLPIPQ